LIVSCPSCGTNYKRPALRGPARARCGCCAGPIDLSGLRPYRIVRATAPSAGDLAKAEAHLPIGLDDPALASRIAARVAGAAPAPLVPLAATRETWDESEPLPEIPEMAIAPPEYARTDGSDEAEQAIADAAPERASSAVVFGFWAAGGAIVGTGTSWTLGGTTVMGIVAGGLTGLAAAWGFLRWTSRP
jgi:hypothetical protein